MFDGKYSNVDCYVANAMVNLNKRNLMKDSTMRGAMCIFMFLVAIIMYYRKISNVYLVFIMYVLTSLTFFSLVQSLLMLSQLLNKIEKKKQDLKYVMPPYDGKDEEELYWRKNRIKSSQPIFELNKARFLKAPERSVKQSVTYFPEASIYDGTYFNNETIPSFDSSELRCRYALSRSSVEAHIYDTVQHLDIIDSKLEQSAYKINFKDDLEELHKLLRTNDDLLTKWLFNARQWMCCSILNKIAQEIDYVNDELLKEGWGYMTIGNVRVDYLKKIASLSTDKHHLRTLPLIIEYLDVSPNHSYIIDRIRVLCKGNFLHDYNWNTGGTFNNCPWNRQLPTDAELLMHMFVTYMNIIVPLHGFKALHYLEAPNSPEILTKHSIIIYKERSNPPHYNLYLGPKKYVIPSGRNNVFYAIVFMLRFIDKMQYQLLDHIHLSDLGVNLLWMVQN